MHDGNNGFVVTESAPEKRHRLAWTFDNAMHQHLKSIWDGVSNIISNKYDLLQRSAIVASGVGLMLQAS